MQELQQAMENIKADERYQAKVDLLNAKRTKLMQKVILLVDQVEKIDSEIEKVEKAETERIGIKYLKELVGQTNGNMVEPEEPNPN